MTAGKDRVVTIRYTLTGDGGQVFDTNEGRPPLEYLHGHGMLLPKFEEALEGHAPGDRFACDLQAKDGYGEYDESLVMDIPREQFESDMEIQVGMAFQAMTEQGPSIVTVKKVTPDLITVDANDSLAGQNLHFAVELVDVREATEDELASGRPAGSSCGCGGECGEDCGCCGGSCQEEEDYDSDEDGMPCPCGCGR